ncbi:MAG TPA: hypothetical protein DDY98_05895 [Ruminococcaceae bacterium]|nr:hypothetical protein [Oscillospiraceae bacterium]
MKKMSNEENEIYCPYSLTGVAAAITSALGAEAPKTADPAVEPLMKFIENKNIDRVVMYNPDAVALWLFEKYTADFLPVMLNAQLTLPLQTVMPSVTPVCFATMYTGATPDIHGIKAYRKPVVKADTVFDALIRAGKKPCIVSTGEDSMSKIFLERRMDYFIVETPDEANEKAAELIRQDKYDLLCVYNPNYDGNMHRVGPEGEEALDALRHNAAAYAELAKVIRNSGNGHRTLLGFAPDHGCHEIDGGSGSHGLMMPEDMNIIHFYTVIE